jgi:hypothetical protein
VKRKIFVLIVGVVSLTGLWYWHRYVSNPFNQPGQTWERSFFLAGDTVRLLDSGHYYAYHWCDICGDEPGVIGTWAQKGNSIVLTSSDPKKRPKTLIAKTVGSCKYLIPSEPTSASKPNEKNELISAFEPEGQQCEQRR